ncbi:MAG: hypothetical protein AMJ84_05450 [Acidithiobacillales bacterium SM23_46]|nr:MAG: hypothetical protein AMJ84_05450 [Acidithiobacillales bacterium SM23_46]
MAWGSYATLNYTEQGGARQVIGGQLDIVSGGELDVESGGALKLKGTAVPSTLSFAAAAGGANVCEVTISVKDNAGNVLAGNWPLIVWLSDDAGGEGLTSTTASGTVQAKSNEGADLTALTAKKHLTCVCKDAGTYVLEITDSAKTGFYVSAAICGGLAHGVSAQVQTADYGS